MKKFESFWNELLIELRTPKKIKNWTMNKGFFGKDFTAQTTSDNKISCVTLGGSNNLATRKDFELVYENWNSYLNGNTTREELRTKSFATTYTISIIRQFIE